MSDLAHELEQYLALRRSLGFKLARPGQLLGQFVEYLVANGADRVTTKTALAWATLPAGADPSWHSARLGAARGFAKYMATLDHANEVPPADLLPGKSRRAVAYIYSEDEVTALMSGAGSLRSAFKAATYKALIGLLWATGMRVGEAIALDRADVDLDEAVLIVRHAKFDKSRQVPVHQSTATALGAYAELRDRSCPASSSPSFFVSTAGTRLIYQNVHLVFHRLVGQAGISARSEHCRPRVHDLRHSFACRAALRTEASDDPRLSLTTLAAYLGHFDPTGTYWYLQATPALLEAAMACLEALQRDGS
ncbi:MAG TPA: tyrosine-type recombinase/integrase [Acidimicrobiales bacterium]|nr:tyrosine-type recombinase/integrase [Acidimicrobiales bacterium]